MTRERLPDHDWRAKDGHDSYYVAIEAIRRQCLRPDGSFDMRKAQSFKCFQTLEQICVERGQIVPMDGDRT